MVLSLSPFTGKTLSKINFDEKFLNNPIQVEKNIYLISKQGTLFILGLEMAKNIIILGKPNAGKSSLLNAFLGKQVAVVNNFEGLTRDLKAIELIINENIYNVIDSPGITKCKNLLEKGNKKNYFIIKKV